jgi:hypothetical protein
MLSRGATSAFGIVALALHCSFGSPEMLAANYYV